MRIDEPTNEAADGDAPSDLPESSLHDVLWPDAAIKSVFADYHAVSITLVESTGRVRTIVCGGHIGYQLVAFWDDVIVERAELTDKDSFLDECLRTLTSTYGADVPTTGDVLRNQRSWQVLSVHLSDGACLRVAAARFSTVEVPVSQ